MTGPIVRASEIQTMLAEQPHAVDNKNTRMTASLGDRTGLKKIGAHLCQACTGQLTTTLHWHEVDEEAFYIVSGRGLLLIKETADSEVREHTVEAGDFIGFPASPCNARAFKGIEGETLTYFCVGTRAPVDICHYPEHGKTLIKNMEKSNDDPDRRRWC